MQSYNCPSVVPIHHLDSHFSRSPSVCFKQSGVLPFAACPAQPKDRQMVQVRLKAIALLQQPTQWMDSLIFQFPDASTIPAEQVMMLAQVHWMVARHMIGKVGMRNQT